MAKKSIDWSDILGPARNFESAVTKTRSLRDLPAVAEGAKEIALLSIFKEEQRFAFEPVMKALKALSELKDWSHSFFVADRTTSEFFDWRKMPLRRYQSFEDFYRRELEEVWGKWETLQATWAEVVEGNISEEEGQRRIRRGWGGDRRSKKARADQGGNTTLKNLKNTKVHILSRLEEPTSRDLALKGMAAEQFADLARKVRRQEISANAAAIEAGFRKKSTWLERQQHTLKKRSVQDCRELLRWLREYVETFPKDRLV